LFVQVPLLGGFQPVGNPSCTALRDARLGIRHGLAYSPSWQGEFASAFA
jgi:hypothetical protein